jgi:hypothetical protein
VPHASPSDRITPPTLVCIFGPPAVGKMTVGQELVVRTGFRLFHASRLSTSSPTTSPPRAHHSCASTRLTSRSATRPIRSAATLASPSNVDLKYVADPFDGGPEGVVQKHYQVGYMTMTKRYLGTALLTGQALRLLEICRLPRSACCRPRPST